MVITERTTEIYGRRGNGPSVWLARFRWSDLHGVHWVASEDLRPKETALLQKEKIRFEKAVKRMTEEFTDCE